MSPLRSVILAATLVLRSTATLAASPFDGLWVVDLKTQMGQAGFDKYLVANGIYECDSCSPRESFPADGKLRPVKGSHSAASESVEISGPRSIVSRIVDQEMTRETRMTVAPDDRTATYVSLDQWPGRPKRLRTEYIAKRVAPAPSGTHPVSGSWLGLRYVTVPEQYRSVRLKEANGQFSWADFRYGHYTATIGGSAVPVTGDGKNIFKASVRAPDERTRVETLLLDGKPVREYTYRLSADGKSLTTIVRDPEDGSIFQTLSHRK